MKELKPKQKSALSIKCHSVYSVLDVLYVFVKVGIELEKCIVLAKISKRVQKPLVCNLRDAWRIKL